MHSIKEQIHKSTDNDQNLFIACYFYSTGLGIWAFGFCCWLCVTVSKLFNLSVLKFP